MSAHVCYLCTKSVQASTRRIVGFGRGTCPLYLSIMGTS